MLACARLASAWRSSLIFVLDTKSHSSPLHNKNVLRDTNRAMPMENHLIARALSFTTKSSGGSRSLCTLLEELVRFLAAASACSMALAHREAWRTVSSTNASW